MLYRDREIASFPANWFVACSYRQRKDYNYYHVLGVYPTLMDAKIQHNDRHIRYVTVLEYMRLAERPQ